jgi:hypothetical protein
VPTGEEGDIVVVDVLIVPPPQLALSERHVAPARASSRCAGSAGCTGPKIMGAPKFYMSTLDV